MQAVCPKCDTLNPISSSFCGNCGASLESAKVVHGVQPIKAEAQPKRQTSAQRRAVPIVVVVLLIILLLIVVRLLSESGASAPSRSPYRSLPTSQPSSYLVRYVVKGTGSQADVTYENAQGGTEQRDIRIPWEQTFTMKGGSFVYLSTQSHDDATRTITCEIWVAGKLYKTSTSSGRYVIATCSGRAGGY